MSVPRHFHPTHPTLTTNDYTKSIYMNLLDVYPIEDVVAYFAAHPMSWEGRRLSTSEALERIWSEKSKVPLVWDYGVGEDLERFLVERGGSIIPFYRKLLYRNNKSTYIPGRFLLKWFYPVLKMVFNSMDPRDMAIRLIPHFTENLLPHHIHRRVKRTVQGEWAESVLAYVSDDHFEEPIHFDSGIHSCEQIKASPGILGLPPYEEVDILAESRPIEKALWHAQPEYSSSGAFLDGERLIIRWHPHDESISVNGEHLVKGIPAKILKGLLTAYTERGQSEFEYREFKRDEEITTGQKRGNFEIRLYRLISIMDEKCPGICLSKSGRGKFRLAVRAELEFQESGGRL